MDKIDEFLNKIKGVINDLPKDGEKQNCDKLIIVKRKSIFPKMQDEQNLVTDDSFNSTIDVPNVVDKTYNTYYPLDEANDEEDPENKKVEDPADKTIDDDAEKEDIADEDAEAKDNPGSQIDANTGMPTDQGEVDPLTGMPQKTDVEIGRIYELKKIFSRLVSIETFLSTSSNEELLLLRTYVVKVIDLFKIMIDNITAFRDRTDEIIVMFYQFLRKTYIILKKYYNLEKDKVGDEKDKK